MVRKTALLEIEYKGNAIGLSSFVKKNEKNKVKILTETCFFG
jgi:hypothetical protein